MNAIVLCHKLQFPKYYGGADFSESQCFDPSKPTSSGTYGLFKSGQSKVIAYVCYTCNKIFTTHNAVLTHTRSHTSAPFSCAECGKTFLAKKYFQRHKHAPHAAAFHCEYCGEKFNHAKIHKYIIHKELEHSVKCSRCEKCFVSVKKLTRHCNAEHPETKPSFSCDLCGMSLSSRRRLKVHLAEHERKAAEKQLQKYRCSFCRAVCLGRANLAAHYRAHMALKSTTAEVDGVQDKEQEEEQKSSEDEAKNDGSSEDEAKNDGSSEDEAKNDGSSEDEAKKDESSEDEAQKDRSSEDEGKEEGKSDGDLKVAFGSLSLGDNLKLYVCYHCNWYFDHRKELKAHMKFHAEGSTVCSACEIDFCTTMDLTTHKKMIHLYKCKWCNLVFVKRSQRKEHKRCHES